MNNVDLTPKIAIVTQSYRGDIDECRLLRKSIERFLPSNIEQHIIVNDEDYYLFTRDSLLSNAAIHKKSEILPRLFMRFPYKVLGHYYHLSPFSIPVREWIIQQICKLGAFDILNNDIDAIMNIDSESVFMQPFELSKIYRGGEYCLFKESFREEPAHIQYCTVARKLLDLKEDVAEIAKNCYMSHPVIFVRDNIEKLQQTLSSNYPLSWKYRLANTYRFSEYYLYGIYTDKILNFANHFHISKHLFPLVNIPDNEVELLSNIRRTMNDNGILGVWLQKHWRNKEPRKIPFEELRDCVLSLW